MNVDSRPGIPVRARAWIKVCGVRTCEEVEWCARYGATHVGVNAWPGSPRFVEEGGRAGLVSAAKQTGLVPVLVAPGAGSCPAGQGSLAPEFVQLLEPAVGTDRKRLADAGIGIVQTARMGAAAVPVLTWGDVLLLDAWVPDVLGGSGRRFDWALARDVHGPFVLAGGLGPSNVAAAVSACRPAGVDAASGLEMAPGLKDPIRIRDFCQAARAALEEAGDAS